MMNKKKTLVLGASANPSRYSFLAIQRLRSHGHPVVAIGRRPARVADTDIRPEKEMETGIDTVTMYMNKKHQEEFHDYILSLKPKRIIFNPGAENEILEKLARDKGIETLEACTLVMLSTNQY
jgi:predicted CoA-binding protein